MSSILLCATPVTGHVAPMVEIGRHLVERGHDVTMITGTRFAPRVTAAGMQFTALEGAADYDDTDPATFLPDRDHYRAIAQAQYDIQTMFIETIPAQFATVQRMLGERRTDAILCDIAFLGVAPLLFEPRPSRPPIIGIGVLPLSQSSADVAPYGMGLQPSRTPLGRLRNRMLGLAVSKVLFRRTQVDANRMLRQVGAPKLTTWVMDLTGSFDRFLQLTVEEFEYQRSDLPPSIRFVGPIAPALHADIELPPWWGALDDGRRVVYVTQGTMDNHDFGRLIVPSIHAARGRDLHLIVTTGRHGAEAELLAAAGELPENVHVAAFLSYETLLPRIDAMITNGGYGGTQQALAHGVPLIAAGDTEDKPEVCARVRYSGAGIDLKTGSPTSEQLGSALDTLLSDPAFTRAAQRIGRSMSAHDALAAISAEVEAASISQSMG